MKWLILVSMLAYFTHDRNFENETIKRTEKLNDSSKIQVSYLQPAKLVKIKGGHYFIDFGKDAFGTLALNFKSAQKDSLKISLGEKLATGNTIDKKPGGTIRYQQISLTNPPVGVQFSLKLPRDKRNTSGQAILLPESFGVIMPFRYCEIENLKIPIEEVLVLQKVYNYRFNDSNSSFSSSDSILNQVWEMGKHTIKATSFAGLYIDGDRERIPYEADAYINQLSHYSVDNEYGLATATNDYFMSHPTWPTEWILHTVLLFYQDYMHTGNIAPLQKHYEGLKQKTLLELEREDGLITVKSPKMTDAYMRKLGFTDVSKKLQDIVDWPAAQMFPNGNTSAMGERDAYEMVDVNTVVNAFHYKNMELMAIIADRLGKKVDAAVFAKQAQLVKRSINEKLFDSTRGVYVDGENSRHAALHANMFPLAFGLVPEQYQQSVTAFVKSRGMACSVYGAQFLLEALYLQGESDYALNLMTSTSDRSWYNMIRVGSTMALEGWDLKYKSNLDWNHAWGTAPVNIVSRYLWGITPSTPGFGTVLIKPQQGSLTQSKIKLPTAKGIITGDYARTTGREAVYKIVLPPSVTGSFVLPRESTLVKNSRAVKERTVQLRPGTNEIRIKFIDR
jgi:alpha-L-rhamnosidase